MHVCPLHGNGICMMHYAIIRLAYWLQYIEALSITIYLCKHRTSTCSNVFQSIGVCSLCRLKGDVGVLLSLLRYMQYVNEYAKPRFRRHQNYVVRYVMLYCCSLLLSKLRIRPAGMLMKMIYLRHIVNLIRSFEAILFYTKKKRYLAKFINLLQEFMSPSPHPHIVIFSQLNEIYLCSYIYVTKYQKNG